MAQQAHKKSRRHNSKAQQVEVEARKQQQHKGARVGLVPCKEERFGPYETKPYQQFLSRKQGRREAPRQKRGVGTTKLMGAGCGQVLQDLLYLTMPLVCRISASTDHTTPCGLVG